MKLHTITIGLVLFCLFAGCAQLRTPTSDYWIAPGQPHASSRAISLLYYAGYVRNLNSSDYSQEVERTRLLYAKDNTDFQLLQYVVALSIPGGDMHKAQQLLETRLNEDKFSDPELGALAQLLDADLTEWRRLEAGTRRAEAGARRADELEKKVEALKNIEKGLIQRDQRSTGVGSPEANHER
jgi:hypothetical protein